MIEIQQLSLQRGSKVLLQLASARIHPGQKVGLIGPNGSGKSSLFKLLLGQLQGDTGHCQIPKQWQIAHMAQEVDYSERLALDYVLDGHQPLRKLEAAIEQATADNDGIALGKLYSEVEGLEGYTATTRAQQLLHGLGFSTSDESRAVSSFSGGWRIRLNLAQALMCPSDLLLLDEPTNHLDLDATLWLEQWLLNYQGTLVMISHDRDFLDTVITQIIAIENQLLQLYSGHYSAYERQRSERLAQQQAAHEKQQQRISEIEQFVRRFKAKASKAKQAQSRLKELERMETIAPAHIDSPFHFTLPVADKMSQPLVNFQQAQLGYADKAVIDGFNLSVVPSSRIGLLGHNGAGKSTLIKTLAGDLPLLSGQRTDGEHLRIGYFAQHQLEALDLEASAALHIQRLSPFASEQQVRNYLGGFGFQGDRAFEIISHFSGGEKARLALALIAWQKPNLLLLDEPTNHLDLEMRHALTVALQQFEGAILVVSHDRHLLRNTVDEFLLVNDGSADEFKGDLDDYQQWLTQSESQWTPVAGTATEIAQAATINTADKKNDKKEQRQKAAAERNRLKPLTQQINKLEQQITKLQDQLESIDTNLSDTDLYQVERADDLQSLLRQQGSLRNQLDQAEEQWLSVSEELEQARAG